MAVGIDKCTPPRPCLAAVRRCCSRVTLEPAVAVIYLSTVVVNLLYVNLILQRACRRNGTVVEPDLRTPCDDEVAGQKYLAAANSWRYSLAMVLMIAFTVVGSAWSERVGKRRRPLIVVPLLGQVAVAFIGCVYAYCWHWPIMPGIVLETVVHGVTGGRLSVLYSSQLYVCDISGAHDRTLRIGIVVAIHTICVPVGNGLAGLLMSHCGLYWSFVVCTGFTMLGVVAASLLIRDTSVRPQQPVSWWRAMNPVGVVQSFRLVLRRRNGDRRQIILLLLVTDALSLFAVVGESTILYPYLRYRFGWNHDNYSFYITYKMSLLFLGTLFGVSVLSYSWKWHDAIIGLVSSTTTILALLLNAFATHTWQLYAGHLMSLRSVMAIITVFCFPVYNYVYYFTLDFFPSAFFFISIMVYSVTIFTFWFTYLLASRPQNAVPITD